MRLASCRVAEIREHALDGKPRRNFAELVPSYAIRRGEEPPVRLRLRRRRWLHVSLEIFVVASGSPRIGQLREVQLQQWLSPQTVQVLGNSFAQQGGEGLVGFTGDFAPC